MAFTQYKNYDVFEYVPILQSIQQGFAVLTDVVSGRGFEERYPANDYPIWQGMYTFIIGGRQRIYELEYFFDTHKGRLIPLWLPSWNTEYKLHFTPLDGSTTLDVDKYAPELTYNSSIRESIRSRTYLRIRNFVSGSAYFAKVLSWNDAYADYTALVLDTPYDKVYDIDTENAWIDFLYFCRFGNDELTYSYLAKDVIEVKLSFVEVPHEYPV